MGNIFEYPPFFLNFNLTKLYWREKTIEKREKRLTGVCFEERVREREKENKFYTGKKENREETHRQVIEGRNAERRTY